MIEKVLNSLNSEIIKRVIVCRDSASEHLSEILFNIIVKIILNKDVKNIILYNYNDSNGERFNEDGKIYEYFVLNLPYYVDINNQILINHKLRYDADVILALKDNKLLLIKHRELSTSSKLIIDMIPFIRMNKINRIKNIIYNKNIIK